MVSHDLNARATRGAIFQSYFSKAALVDPMTHETFLLSNITYNLQISSFATLVHISKMSLERRWTQFVKRLQQKNISHAT